MLLTGLPLHLSTAAPELPDAVSVLYGQPFPHKKRIHRAERERLENRRRTSQVKTWFRRLEDAVRDGDAERAAEEHRSLSSRIDRAVKSGALHRNNGAHRRPAPSASARRPRRSPDALLTRSGPGVGSAVETRLLIGGEQVAGEGDSMAVENPGHRGYAHRPEGALPEQIDAAIAAADTAFSAWAGTPRSNRPSFCTRSPPHARAHRELARR